MQVTIVLWGFNLICRLTIEKFLPVAGQLGVMVIQAMFMLLLVEPFPGPLRFQPIQEHSISTLKAIILILSTLPLQRMMMETTSGPIPVSGLAGATYYGFGTTGVNCMLTTITINVGAGSGGYAVGEFGINVDYNNGALSCNNNIQISLDQNCLLL